MTMPKEIPNEHTPTDMEHELFKKNSKTYLETYAVMRSNMYGTVSNKVAKSDKWEKNSRSVAYDAMVGIER